MPGILRSLFEEREIVSVFLDVQEKFLQKLKSNTDSLCKKTLLCITLNLSYSHEMITCHTKNHRVWS